MNRLDLAGRVLELVGSVAPGAQAEVHVTARSRALTRFARSFVHQNVVDTAERIRLRVVLVRSWAAVETDRADADTLVRTVESAVAAARLRPADPAFPGLAPAGSAVDGGNWDDATADATPDQRAAVVRDFVDAAGGLETAGYVQTERTEAVYANTLGRTATGRVTAAAADGIARVPGADGVARHAAVRLWDSPDDPLSTALPYDADGIARRRVDLVTDGVSTAVAHDRRTAAAAGVESGGHAVEGGERWGPAAPQLRVGTGTGGDAAALAAGMDRGLLVSDFWYTRVLDPRTVVVTGLTRNGVWLVEGGRIVRPVSTLRFTQAYPAALEPGAVLGVGSDATPLPLRAPGHLTVTPSLRLARWNITGGATG